MEENQQTDNHGEVPPSERSTHVNEAPAGKEDARRRRNNRLLLFGTMAALLALAELLYFLDAPNPLPAESDLFRKPNIPPPQTQTPKPVTITHETPNSYADSMAAHQRENAAAINEHRSDNAFLSKPPAVVAARPDTLVKKPAKPLKPDSVPAVVPEDPDE